MAIKEQRRGKWLDTVPDLEQVYVPNKVYGWESGAETKMLQARLTRLRIVEWLRFEIKKAFIDMVRQKNPEHYYCLTKFARAIVTSRDKRYPEWWLERKSKTPQELFEEYMVNHRAIKDRKKDRSTSKGA